MVKKIDKKLNEDFKDLGSTTIDSNGDGFDLDFNFDNFESQIEKEIDNIKNIEDFENVIDNFINELDFDLDMEIDEDDLGVDDIIKE